MNVYFQTKCARETRNEYCESSRVSLTRQLRDWVPQEPIWRRIIDRTERV